MGKNSSLGARLGEKERCLSLVSWQSTILTWLMILAVSATDDIRDELRRIVRVHLANYIKFFELDYNLCRCEMIDMFCHLLFCISVPIRKSTRSG